MKTYSALRLGRIAIQCIAAAACAVALVFALPSVFVRMQIVPAIAACSGLWISAWVAITMIFGRIYCSTACPAGALIDFSAWLLRKRRSHYSFTQPLNRLRFSILVIVAICALCGLTAVVAISDPYSAYGRIIVAVCRPLAIGVAGLAVATATLLAIAFASMRRGRLLCNTICPVGTALSCMSRYALYHPDINTDLCTNCGKCADSCSAECINLSDHTVDLSRCVVCFDCMAVCPDDAITYRRGRHHLSMPMMQRLVSRQGVSAVNAPSSESSAKTIDRRTFILTGMIAAAGTAIAKHTETASDTVADSHPLLPLNYVTPPGITSRNHYLRRCTACGACIAACPTGVLTTSTNQFGIRHAIVPVMDFDHAFCRIDCVKCTHVCPTKALSPLTPAEKRSTPIGKARINISNCILYANDTPCGDCASHCPKDAISIVLGSDNRSAPQLEFDSCIGCGKCISVCPAEPYKAIVIEGL